jgi:hypothetical protein
VTILFFWLAASMWMFFREAWPWLQVGEPPPYSFELTDEVGTSHSANVITWDILQKGETVGFAQSSIRRFPDRLFELKTEYHFRKGNFLKLIEFKKWSYKLRVNLRGELRALDSHVRVEFVSEELAKLFPRGIEMEVHGAVEKGQLSLQPRVKHERLQLPPLDPVPAPKRVLNPLHLLNRFPGLWEGRTWKEPLFNPLSLGSILPAKLGSLLPGELIAEKHLLAEVKTGWFAWHEKEMPCFKIEYREPGQKIAASTWVRRRDGLILQQEANHMGLDLVVRRVPPR